MRGIITEINAQRGMVSVKTDNGFSIFELLSHENINVGDKLEWNTDALGDCQVKNITQDETIEVYFQNHSVAAANVKKLLY
jgi:hypothetical protein